MLYNHYVIYQSLKAANDMFAAMRLTKITFGNVHYIDEETAAANLDMAQLKILADAADEVM